MINFLWPLHDCENPTALSMGFPYAGNKNNGVRVGIAGEF
jgi:hypothetical protein